MSDRRIYEGNGRRWEAASLVGGLALAVITALALTGTALPQSHSGSKAAPKSKPAPAPGLSGSEPQGGAKPGSIGPAKAPASRLSGSEPQAGTPRAVPRGGQVGPAARHLRHRRVAHRGARPERVSAVERFARLGLPLVCGGSQARVVALTFDDGPGPHTPQILALLRRHRARATFFVVGNRIDARPGILAAEAKVGAVGDHTWSHAFLPRLSAGDAAAEVVRGRRAVERAVGANVRLFRPPYDGRSADVERRLRARGMLEVLWSIDTSDYLPGRSPSRILRELSAQLRPGSIVLMHDIQPRTVEVLRRLLPLLHRRHLRPVGIPELLRVDPPSRRLLAAGGPGCWRRQG